MRRFLPLLFLTCLTLAGCRSTAPADMTPQQASASSAPINLVIRPSAWRLEIRLFNGENEPIPNGVVGVFSDNAPSVHLVTGIDGSASLLLRPGVYHLQAYPRGYHIKTTDVVMNAEEEQVVVMRLTRAVASGQ